MRLTIIKNDNVMLIDGVAVQIDFSDLPSSFHALQWYDTWGEIEWIERENGAVISMRNERIEDLSDYQHFLTEFEIKKKQKEEEMAAVLENGGVIT